LEKDSLVQRLMATFVGELEDHVRSLERNLLALEKSAAPAEKAELFATLFRTAHSLKGSARLVKATPLENMGHRLEELFAAARDGKLTVDRAFFELILPAVDAIAEAGRRLRAGADLSATRLDECIRHIGSALRSAPKGRAIKELPWPPRGTPPAARAEELPPPERDGWSRVVRVPAEKLDALVMQSGELLLVRHRIEARSEEAVALEELVGEWRRDWRKLELGLALLGKRGATAAAAPPGGETNGDARAPGAIPRQLEQAVGRGKETLWRIERGMQRLAGDLAADRRALEQTADPLDAEVRRTRMVPFAEACEGLERMARDLTAGGEKAVRLVLEGGELALDRAVLEGLKDPLIHIVRNAIDHGIEPIEARRAAGKAELGRVTISAVLRGPRVEVTIADDGRGLDLGAIGEQLKRRETDLPDDARELARTIFLPGLSTSRSVTQLSGRGVGLDVVKTRLETMRGTVEIDHAPGRGTKFILSLPLTLSSVRAILARAGGQVFAFDTTSVRRVLRVAAEDIRSIEAREVIQTDEGPVGVATLSELLNLPPRPIASEDSGMPAIVLASEGHQAAFVVDEFLAEREVLLRALGPRLKQIEHVTGATLLPEGLIALILNASSLIARVRGLPMRMGVARAIAAEPAAARKRLLVVDDSVTIRTLEKSILEAAGYEVLAAADGVEAWQMLLEKGADLVVSDVEMPRMDGFTLTEAIRGSKRFRTLPVILVTAMEREADKARGLAVGADAYRVKSAFDQKDLLDTIAQFL
jgi:two-component system chemotaxis sensor kinase CheA